jgi:hypothetical protein
VRVDLVFEGGHVHGLGEPRADLFDLLCRLGIDAEVLGLLDGLGELRLDCAPVLGLVGLEGRADLRQKILVEESDDLLAPRVHDAVDAEVQLGLVG